MITFKWHYGKEQLTFEETLDENKYRDNIFENSIELGVEEKIKENDFESESYLKQPSDYLFDFHLLKLMKKTILNNEYNITNKEIHLYYDVIQKFLAYNKGILVFIDKIRNSENTNTDLCEDIFSFIDTCRNTMPNTETFNEIRETFPKLFDENSSCYNEVIAIEEYFLNLNNNYYYKQPYYLYEKLVMKISPIIKERRQLVKMIKHILPYRPYWRNNGMPLTCQMILNDDNYFGFIGQASSLIVSDVEKTINSYLAFTSITEDNFKDSVNHMINCINSCDKSGNHNFGRFIGKKKGCFCLFDINTDEYISLSGPFDATDCIIVSYFGYDRNKINSNNELMNKINNIILSDSTLSKSKYAKLNLLTKRYPYTTNSNISSSGETIDDAINQKIDKNEIQSDYSCCERKIFSYISATASGMCYMFVRHEPCKKCKPAIKDFLQTQGRQMRIFYYDNDIVKEFDVSTI